VGSYAVGDGEISLPADRLDEISRRDSLIKNTERDLMWRLRSFVSSRRFLLPLATSILSVLLLDGCPRLICDRNADVRVDGRYRVTILEVYDLQTTFKYSAGLAPQQGEIMTCPANLRPSVGTALDLHAMGEVQPRHRCPLVRSDLVGASADVSVIGPSADAVATSAVQGIRSQEEENALIAVDAVAIGGCTGTVALSIIPGGDPGGFFAAPMTAQLPPAMLYWFFSASGPGCAPCQVSLAVQVEKLP
jgi:hypothetical protein